MSYQPDKEYEVRLSPQAVFCIAGMTLLVCVAIASGLHEVAEAIKALPR